MDTRVHSSVTEQLTADQQVPGSIPGVPLGVASFSAGDVELVAWVQSEFDTNRSRRNREDRARGGDSDTNALGRLAAIWANLNLGIIFF